jgi:5'-nucleotidase
MRILVSNDDGVRSAGIQALAESLSGLGEIWIVAPDRERSAASHSISLHQPLRVHRLDERTFSTDGTPADCVYLAVNHLLKDQRPDLVVSGINHGPNLGDDITYSGTVAAAFEGTMLGIPSIAFSLCVRGRGHKDLLPAGARFARSLVEGLAQHRLQPGVLLNVNIPAGSDGKTYRITRQGKRSYGTEVLEREDPRGRKYYWIGGDELAHVDLPGSDANAVYDDGVISVTPLHLNMTHDATRVEMLSWHLPGTTPAGMTPSGTQPHRPVE